MWKSTTPPNQHSRYGLLAWTGLEGSGSRSAQFLEMAGFTFPAVDYVYMRQMVVVMLMMKIKEMVTSLCLSSNCQMKLFGCDFSNLVQLDVTVDI